MNKHNLLLLLAALSPMTAHATASWNFTTPGTVNYGSQGTFNSSAGTVTVSAFSTTGATGTGGNPQFASGTLGSWSGGIGVTSAEDGTFYNSPNHAFDNDGNSVDEKPAGDVDAAVFSFNQSINLDSISIGWYSGDADISVLAYTGNSGNMANPEDITGKTFTDLLANGWEFIGNYMNLYNMPDGTADINPTDVSSSYWLVSAYTSCANNSCNPYDGYFGNDYFKIDNIGGTTTGGGGGSNTGSVPEPSSLLLLAAGLLGWRLHRYAKAQQANLAA